MSAAPSAAPSFSASDARPGHERQVTSRRAWRRDLPTAPPVAANDNEAPISRPAPAPRELPLEAMLGWTYRQQLAHRVISMDPREGPIDKYLWAMDQQGMIELPSDRRQLHIDAAIVHEAVQDLGTELAAMIIQAAMFGDWPQWMDVEECRPHPVEPRDRYEAHGWYVDADGKRAEYVKKTFEYVSIPKEEWEVVGRKKVKRAKTDSNEKVPVDGCLIMWDPEPEFVEANNRLVALWQTARPVLMRALRDAPFKNHVLAPDAPVAANDNEAGVANDNETAQVAMFG